MKKEEVIKAIDKLIDLENQKQSILSEYQDVIIDYVKDYNSPVELFFENCDYIRDLLTKAKEDIINYWDEEHEESSFDDEINEALRLAGIQLNENDEDSEQQTVKVNDILVDDEGREYIVTEIDNSYGTDNYGQPAYYITVRRLENGKTVGGGLGFPSTAMHYVFHKKS